MLLSDMLLIRILNFKALQIIANIQNFKQEKTKSKEV